MEFRYVTNDVYLGALSVTAAQYDRFAAATQLPMPSACTALPAEAPVVGVTWVEALACAYWFGGTLPSEAHWEDAASVHGRFKYATASGRLSQALAHYDKPFASGTPVPQRDYSPTPSGFFGMCGNTWDWCSDSWDTHRAIRGGCWMDSERFCDTRARYRNAPVDRDTAVGFRVQIHVHKRKDGRYETRRNGFPELDC
jgi:formylglycine-generating enzyme required for sulfatase activity